LDHANKNIVIRIADNLEDSERDQLRKYKENTDFEAHDKKVLEQLKKRKLVNVVTNKSYKVTKGENFQPQR
jgi:phenylalanyl-tRNA synthetase alpha chain